MTQNTDHTTELFLFQELNHCLSYMEMVFLSSDNNLERWFEAWCTDTWGKGAESRGIICAPFVKCGRSSWHISAQRQVRLYPSTPPAELLSSFVLSFPPSSLSSGLVPQLLSRSLPERIVFLCAAQQSSK